MCGDPNPVPEDQAPAEPEAAAADLPPPDHLATARDMLGINAVIGYGCGPLLHGLKTATAAREDALDTEALRARALAHMRRIGAR